MAEEDGGVAEGGGAGRERDGAADGELPHPLLAVSVQATGARPAVSSPFADRLVCINDRAVWNLSGAKPGNGVDELLDGDVRSARGRSCFAAPARAWRGA
jgi:hypothetical protein